MHTQELIDLRDALRYFSDAGSLLFESQRASEHPVAFCAEHEGLLWLATIDDALPDPTARHTLRVRVRFTDGMHAIELHGQLACSVDARAAHWLETPLVEQALHGVDGRRVLLALRVSRYRVRELAPRGESRALVA